MCQFTTIIYITMSTSLNLVMTYNSIVMKTKLGHSLKSIFDDRNGLPFFSMTHSHIYIHSLTHLLLFFFGRKLLLFQCLCPKKVNAIWAHINIPYYTSFNTQHLAHWFLSMCACAYISSLSCIYINIIYQCMYTFI